MKDKKKLLVLGSSNSTYDLVTLAKKIGYHVIVASSSKTGPSIEIADEQLLIDVSDTDKIVEYINTNDIQGVFTGPSEFHIQNVMKVCDKAGLPFYTTKEIWETCSDKKLFKELCRESNVPFVPEYQIPINIDEINSDSLQYPVIVKPVDGCSSKGITVCNSLEEVKNAIPHALNFSDKNKFIVEKYIQNEGIVTNVRYLASNGEIYLSLLGDTYVVDPVNKTALITAVTVFPSMFTSEYLRSINNKVKKMFKGIGVNNASFFMQSLPYNGSVVFHEMGMRISGGLIYKITEPINGINDLNMMIRYAMGEKMCANEELKQLDPYLNNKIAIDFCIPLKEGTIKEIKGFDKVLLNYDIIDFTQYYNLGDKIKKEYIGSLLQHFCRIKFYTSTINKALNIIDNIQNTISITSTENENMIFMKFDVNRIKKFEKQYENS